MIRAESLPAPGDWDRLLCELSFRLPHLLTDDEFLPESAFRDLLTSSSGDATARVALIAVCRNFFVTLCCSLQSSPYSRSSLARGLSSFDPDGVINGPEATQVHSFQELLVVLETHGWTSPPENASLVEAYRSFIGSLRSNGATYDGTGAHSFIAGREELRVNRGLHSVFCLISLYSTRRPETFPDVTIPLEGSSLTPHTIRTMVRVVQSYVQMDPDVTGHFADVSYLNGLNQTFRTVRSSFTQVRFSPWTAVLRSSRGVIQSRLREHFDQLVSRQEQSPSFRLASSRPGFSVPAHVVQSPVGPRRLAPVPSTLSLAAVSGSAEPSVSSAPDVAVSSLTEASDAVDGGQSNSITSTSVVSEPVRPHVSRLPAAPETESSQSSSFSRVAYKTVRGRARQSRRLVFRSLDRDNDPS